MRPIKFFFHVLAGLVLLAGVCNAQAGYVYTKAGGAGIGYAGDGGPALNAMFMRTGGVCKDAVGNLYISDINNYRIRKVDAQTGIITTIAGNGQAGYSGDGGAATVASINLTFGLGVDDAGNVYIPDLINGRIRKVDVNTGVINTIAGGGTLYNWDSCLATSVQLFVNSYVFHTDPVGNCYIYYAGKMSKINAVTGMIHVVAGNGMSGYSGDGGPAINAGIDVTEIVTDACGNIYFTDETHFVLRKIDGSTGIITTIAGTGIQGYSGDGGLAINAQAFAPNAISLDIDGNIFFVDDTSFTLHSFIRKIDKQTGVITKVAGDPSGSDAEGIPALSATMYPWNLYVDAYKNIYYTTYWDDVRMITGDSVFQYSPVNTFTVQTSSGCNTGLHAIIGIPHYSTNYTVTTWFGDGSSANETLLPGWGGGYAVVEHNYPATGVYTIKHVLYDGSVAVDSNEYTYNYVLCRTLSGTLYMDGNSNCIYDAGSDKLVTRPILIAVDSNGVNIDTLSTTSGYYYNAAGNLGDIYTFKVVNPPSGMLTTCPLNGTWHDTIQAQVLQNPRRYFGFECAPTSNFDLSVEASFIRTAANRFDADIIVYNNFCTPQNATMTLTFSPGYFYTILSVGNTYPSYSNLNGNNIAWNLDNVSAADHPRYIHTTLWAPWGQYFTPGDTVHTTLSVTPTTGDVAPGNNIVIRQDTVTGPYDPNAIYVSPSNCVTPGTNLKYTITFENLGNDTAHNVYIMDTLNNGFDMQSMKITMASHVMNVSKIVSGGYNILKFEFPNIDLPDSSNPGRHGFVQYTIDAKDNYPIGSSVTNHAGIYFDYMPAVLTNVAATEMCWPVSVGTTAKNNNNIFIYPNPAHDELTIKTDKAYKSYTISNSIGQVMMEDVLKSKELKVNIKSLPAGLYYISIGTEVKKFVKM